QPKNLPAGEAECLAGVNLVMRDRADGAAVDFRLVGGGVEGEGEQAAVEGFAEEPPQPDIREEVPELPAAVVEEVSLRQERRAPEKIDIAVGNAAQPAVTRQPRQSDRDGEQR